MTTKTDQKYAREAIVDALVESTEQLFGALCEAEGYISNREYDNLAKTYELVRTHATRWASKWNLVERYEDRLN